MLEALYDEHEVLKARKEVERQVSQSQEMAKLRESYFKNPASQTIRIQSFIKEFRVGLGKLLEIVDESTGITQTLPKPIECALTYDQVIQLLKSLDFLPERMTPKFIETVEDLYQVMQAKTFQKVNAKDLQVVLMAITGIFDQSKLAPSEAKPVSWMTSGHFGEQPGSLYFKQGELALVQNHFQLLYITRLQQKKYAKKAQQEESKQEIKMSSQTRKLAEKRRSKMLQNPEIAN